MVSLYCLFLLLFLNAVGGGATTCRPDQASALLDVKNSLSSTTSSILRSWRAGTDCCAWEGVTCDDAVASGQVTALDLSDSGISGDLHPALFNLTSLRYLDLAGNQFYQPLPSFGFERLSELNYLNLSNSGFTGQVPVGIARLTRLLSLYLSTSLDHEYPEFRLHVQEPSFQVLVSNLSNLRELYLDYVNMSLTSTEWCGALATCMPQLRVLSMSGCLLNGPIDPLLLQLRSLAVIRLSYNFLSSVVPDFSKSLVNLSILLLNSNELVGLFPPGIFQLTSLREIDLSGNYLLSGWLPDFPSKSALEVMIIKGNNFSSFIPNSIGNLKSLKILELEGSGFSGELPASIGQLKSLTKLGLYGCDFSGQLPSSLGDLKSLITLSLSDSRFSGAIPSSISNLKSLTTLSIYNCSFFGVIPDSIGNLHSLLELQLSNSAISGPIPYSIGNLTSLQVLDLSNCNFSGLIPPSIANLTQLTRLYLSQNNLTGEIPFDVHWPRISEIDLSHNSFSGPIPYSFRKHIFPSLKLLSLMNNSLSGTVSHILFTLPSLRSLVLASNQLSGPIKSFSKPSVSLSLIDLSSNKLNGSIPTSFSGFASLEQLWLQSNMFDGIVELRSFLRLQKLSFLFLSNNRLSVVESGGNSLYQPLSPIYALGLVSCNLTKLPTVLRYLHNIDYLDLSSNQISGSIPKWIWQNSNGMEYMNLSHNMFDSIEDSPVIIPILVLDLSYNTIRGSVPIPQVSALLDYSNNEFTFILPNFTLYMNFTTYFKASRNKLNGSIPNTICSASYLRILDLSYNNFSGQIPSCLMEGGVRLSILNLRGNNFNGILPHRIKEGCHLRTIDFNGNSVKGELPRSLTLCNDLEILDLGGNHIVDTFPSWLGKLPRLKVLVLRSNQFHGMIRYPLAGDSSSNEFFPSLKIIDVASNNFSGSLHAQWFQRLKSLMADDDSGQIVWFEGSSGQPFYRDVVTVTFKGLDLTFTKILTTFTVMDFSSNGFCGDIPGDIARLIALHGLNLSHNAFTGQIPSQLGGLSRLESLDLSSNQLTGEIPQELTNLTYLAWLNLSYNNLSGRIPQERQFLTFSENAFQGNIGLCGRPLSKQCSGSNNSEIPATALPSRSDRTACILLFFLAGSGFGIGFAAAIIAQLYRKKLQNGLPRVCRSNNNDIS